MFELISLDASLGAEVVGLDLAAGWDQSTLRALLAAFYHHQVLVIRDQQRLAPADFVALARTLGRPQPHILSHMRHPEHPEILFLSNVFRDGKPIGVYDGAAFWHTDMSYEEDPGTTTLVHCLQTPSSGGETRFANMVAAYQALPEATQARIDDLSVLHHYGNRQDPVEGAGSRTAASPLSAEQRKQVKNTYYPLVRRHPVTGRKALYGVSGSSFGIVGMDDHQATALLDELAAHATQPRFIYSHRYRVGDVVLWDNLSTLHSASLIDPASGPEDTRLLHRISVKGLAEVLGIEASLKGALSPVAASAGKG